MSDSLWFTFPGGIRVATEEALVLADALSRAREWLDQAVDSLHRVPSHPGLDVRPLHHGLSTARDECTSLREALDRYALNVASQEHWRTAVFQRSRDGLISAGVRALLPPGSYHVSRSGHNPWSHTDDAAAALLGGSAYRAPDVTVRPWSEGHEVAPPAGLAERLARIPPSDTPIRIDRYDGSGDSSHVEVYIAGTENWGVGHSSHPFDLGSNLALVGGVTASSLLATERAMRLSGVTARDRVVFVGHSQGGAIATTLAESGRYRTAGLVTFGAPTGTLPVHGDYPAVLIEHRDDLVPTLGGARTPTGALVVQTESAGSGSAHSREAYLVTAERVDQSRASAVRQFQLPTPGGIGDSVVWSASQERTRTSFGEMAERTTR